MPSNTDEQERIAIIKTLHRIRKRLLTTIEQQKKYDVLKIFSFLL